MFEYMYQWLTIATTERASQSTEIQLLLGEVNLTIHKASKQCPVVTTILFAASTAVCRAAACR